MNWDAELTNLKLAVVLVGLLVVQLKLPFTIRAACFVFQNFNEDVLSGV